MSAILLAFFQLLIVGWETVTSALKTKNTNTVDDGNRSVFLAQFENSSEFHRTVNKH